MPDDENVDLADHDSVKSALINMSPESVGVIVDGFSRMLCGHSLEQCQKTFSQLLETQARRLCRPR